MFLMMGSDFGNEIELGSAFGSKDNIPHQDTSHEEDWACLARFLNCLDNSHGNLHISLKDKEKSKIPENYKEEILNWTEGGFKKEEEKPKENPNTSQNKTSNSENKTSSKTLKDWYESKQITYQEYKLLTTPWTEGEEWEYQREAVLDTNQFYNWVEIQEYLKNAKKAKQKELEKKRREEAIERKMNDGKDWGNIHHEFKGEWGETYKRNWVACNFNYQQCKEWIDIGLTPSGENGDNAFFAAWLRDKKRMNANQVLNSVNIKKLREEYEKNTVKYFD